MSAILVTNDDGVHSHGINLLYKALQAISDVYIVAPDRERSASGHSLTLHKPLKVQKIGDKIYSVNGTPTDCVAVGVEKILPERPSLIVSGINHGQNLGDDITYSGTVSAAMEGTILNIPSFAVSLVMPGDTGNNKPHFETAAEIAVWVASRIIEKALPYDTFLNVNIPDRALDEIAGIKFTRQGKRVYDGAIQETYSPWGEKFFWIGGGRPFWEHGEDTDISAVLEGYVSVTPVHLDLTNHGAIDFLRKSWEQWNTRR